MLKYGLGIVLIFVGLQDDVPRAASSRRPLPDRRWSLGIIVGVIALSIVASLLFPQGPHDEDEPPMPMPLGHELMTHDSRTRSRGARTKEKKS